SRGTRASRACLSRSPDVVGRGLPEHRACTSRRHVSSPTPKLGQASPHGRGRTKPNGMSTPTTHTHHAIDYLELTVTDMDAAKRFYAAAFGWSFNDYGPEYQGIAGMQGSAKEQGGLTLGAKVTTGPGVPLVVLFSSDLEKTLAAVKKAGGRVTKEP